MSIFACIDVYFIYNFNFFRAWSAFEFQNTYSHEDKPFLNGKANFKSSVFQFQNSSIRVRETENKSAANNSCHFSPKFSEKSDEF